MDIIFVAYFVDHYRLISFVHSKCRACRESSRYRHRVLAFKYDIREVRGGKILDILQI